MQKKAINYLWATVMTMVLLVLPVSAGAGKKQMPEEYAAKVNGSVVTWEFFERAVNQVEQRFARMGKPLSDSQLSEIKKDVLEELINRELLFQESQKSGVKVEAAEAKEQLDRMRSQYATEAEFKRALNTMGFFETNIELKLKEWMEIRRFVNDRIEGHPFGIAQFRDRGRFQAGQHAQHAFQVTPFYIEQQAHLGLGRPQDDVTLEQEGNERVQALPRKADAGLAAPDLLVHFQQLLVGHVGAFLDGTYRLVFVLHRQGGV